MKTITAFVVLELCMFALILPNAPKKTPVTADTVMVSVDSMIEENRRPLNAKARCLRHRIDIERLKLEILDKDIDSASPHPDTISYYDLWIGPTKHQKQER